MSEPTVTQADRDAAADWCASQPFPSKQVEAPSIRDGNHDHHSLVQAFARHREQALAEGVAKGIETARNWARADAQLLDFERDTLADSDGDDGA